MGIFIYTSDVDSLAGRTEDVQPLMALLQQPPRPEEVTPHGAQGHALRPGPAGGNVSSIATCL